MLTSFALGSVLLFGCQDELPPPTHGVIRFDVNETVPGAAEGARYFVDGVDLATLEKNGDGSVELIAGSHTLKMEVDGDCITILPSAEQSIEVEATKRYAVAWTVDVAGGLIVDSNVPGLPVYLNGMDTGEVTPVTFECQEPGDYVVSLGAELTGFGVPEAQSATVGQDLVTTTFQVEPLDQSRGAMVEVLTAVNCSFCLPVDEAAERLWEDPNHEGAGVVSVQVHHAWQNSDVFRTPENTARNTLYGFPPNSGNHPGTRTNGLSPTVGFPNGETTDTFFAAMVERIEPFLTGTQNEPILAIYWLASGFDETSHTATGRLRVVALGEIPNPEQAHVLGMIYKNDLTTFAAVHRRDVEFYRVVRDIESFGTCSDLGILERGDFADVEVSFDLSWDTGWSEEQMGLIGIVQDLGPDGASGTREIYNVRHVFLQ